MSKPWACPGCLQLVPARVETCYCGQERSRVPAPATARDSGLRGFAWTALAVAVAGVALAALSLRQRSPEPRDVTAHVAARPPVTIATAIPPLRQPPPGSAAPTTAASAPIVAGLSPSPEPSAAPVESLDDVRNKAAQAFDGGLQQLAGRVESFRGTLRDYQNGCRSGGGPWPASGCDALRQDLRQRLEEMRTRLETLDEEARRASVYPGVRAQLRRQHGLDDDTWGALLGLALQTLE